MSFKISVDKDDMPVIIKLFNVNHPNTFYAIIGEEEVNEKTKVSIIVNTGREDDVFEDLFDKLGDITIIENINAKEI